MGAHIALIVLGRANYTTSLTRTQPKTVNLYGRALFPPRPCKDRRSLRACPERPSRAREFEWAQMERSSTVILTTATANFLPAKRPEPPAN